MEDDCEIMLSEASNELFALSLILTMLGKGEGIEASLAEKGLSSVAKCQRLVRRGLGIDGGPTRH